MINSSTEVRLKPEEIDLILQNYVSQSPDIQAITVLSPDGLPIVSTATNKREYVIAAMAAASLSLSDRVLTTLNKGEMKEIIITGTDGFAMICSAGENAVVSITAIGYKNYGLVRVIAKKIAKLVSEQL